MTQAGSDPRGDLPAAEPFGRDVRPIVAVSRGGVPVSLIVVLGLIVALALFLLLDARRRARVAGEEQVAGATFRTPAPPPALVVPPPPPPPAPVVIRVPVQGPPQMPPPPPQMPVRNYPPNFSDERTYPPPGPPGQNGPKTGQAAMVVDLTTGGGVATDTGAATGTTSTTSDDAVRATMIRNRGALVPQGTIIAAVLETPLNSDRPGLARAIVSRDARSFDGSRVLIPRGSRLIGEFRADGNQNQGQSRILVTWTRLIRPDGVAIRIGSPAADSLGGAGIAGSVNSHFFERFASAVLQSALAIGTNLASQKGNANVYVGLPSQTTQIGTQLIPGSNRAPTVKVPEGAEIAIVVARDLDFGGTPPVR